MENYFYKCPVCGFIHIVPAYWVSFSPEKELVFPHVHPDTKENCSHSLQLSFKELTEKS